MSTRSAAVVSQHSSYSVLKKYLNVISELALFTLFYIGYKMYRNCFCVKVTPPVDDSASATATAAAASGDDDKQVNQVSTEAEDGSSSGTGPPIPPARRQQQYSQFGQYKYQNCSGSSAGGGNRFGAGQSSSSPAETRAAKMAQIAANRKGFDANNKRIQCAECKHEDYFEWCWDKTNSVPTTSIFDDHDHNILFNPGFSVGTGAVRGTKPLELGKHHFFEILMNTEVYGTDMMIGVGTDKVNLQEFAHSFVHFLGYDKESWGLSYSGDIHHAGEVRHYTTQFNQGTYIGVHVDLWTGTLEYYVNRRPMGKAFTGLQDKILYPMLSSTAARSGMNLTYCRSFTPTLQLQSLLALSGSSFLPSNTSIVDCGLLPPGLKSQIKKQFWWIAGGTQNTSLENIFARDANKENQKNAGVGGAAAGHPQQQSSSKSSGNPIKICRRKKVVLPPASVGTAGSTTTNDGEVAGPSGYNSKSTSSEIPESQTTSNKPNLLDNEDGEDSPLSSDSESRDSKRIRLRTASITPID